MADGAPSRISRRTALKWGALVAAAPPLGRLPVDVFAAEGDSVALRWNQAALQGVRDSRLGPPMVARALAIVHTCAHDAWAAYDHRALGARLAGALRRPAREHTVANVNAAISFAAYRAAVDIFPGSRVTVFDPLMSMLGYDPGDHATDATTASGVGNVAAAAVLAFRHRDGANQLGDEPGGLPGVPTAGGSKFESGAVPATEVTLRWATFREAADQAGISRRYGGIHFEQGDLDARAAGRLVAQQAWAKAQTYFNGTTQDD